MIFESEMKSGWGWCVVMGGGFLGHFWYLGF